MTGVPDQPGLFDPSAQAKSAPPPDMMAARTCALDFLEKILVRKLPFDSLLENEAAFKALNARDRSFVHMLVATTLRRLGQIDDFLTRAQDRPDTLRPQVITNILRLGAAQIAFMDVPDHAAVDTSVRLSIAAGLEGMKGFVNAVLRRITREKDAWMGFQDGARLNVPEWLMRVWTSDYGEDEAALIAQASLGEAPLDISVKIPDMIPFWAETLEADILPGGTLRRAAGGGAVSDFPGFADGMWWVQDAAAAFPARLFGEIAGRDVVDLCAAPGGKTAQLAAMGAQVTAVDRSAARMKMISENMERLRLSHKVNTICADATLWRPAGGPGSAPFVLLDAPCTATGTIRRHPDVLHVKTPMDMDRMTGLQHKLLSNAVAMLAPGGILVYCTCSVQKDEGERQIENLLASGAPMRRMPVTLEESGERAEFLTDAGDVRILPSHEAAQGGMDGFFVSRLQKI